MKNNKVTNEVEIVFFAGFSFLEANSRMRHKLYSKKTIEKQHVKPYCVYFVKNGSKNIYAELQNNQNLSQLSEIRCHEKQS